MEQTFRVSTFQNKKDTKPQVVERTWQELCQRFQKPPSRKVKDGQLFSPALFEPAHRRKDNVRELSLLCFDVDHDADVDHAKKCFDRLNCAYAIYATHSHLRQTDTNPNAEPRYRVVVPLVCPITADKFPNLWQFAKHKTQMPFDENAKDTSRMFYTPVKADRNAPYEFFIKDGDFLDWRELPLDSYANDEQPNNANNAHDENQKDEKQKSDSTVFEFNEDRHAELCRIIESRAKSTGRGTYEMKCPAHNGKGDTSLFYDPKKGTVACLKKPNKCSYFEILASFGLSSNHLPSRERAATFSGLPETLPENNLITPTLNEKLLPDVWHEWLADISERLQCPLDYAAVSALVASGALIGNRIRVRPKRFDSWLVVGNLWGGIVGVPGVMKTPAVNEGLIFFREIAERERLKFENSLQSAEFDKEFNDAKKKEISKKMAKATLVEKQELRSEYDALQIEEQKEKRLWTTDVTVEKLGELLNENPEGLLILRDELTGWFRMLDRVGHEQDRAFYLEAWNGEGSFTFDRIGRGKTHIKNLTVSILGTIQPAMIEPYLRGSLEGYGDDGLIQRFQVLVNPETPKSYRYVDQIPKGREKARTSFKNLYEMKPQDIGARFLTAEAGGHAFLQFNDEAQDFFQVWLTELETALRSDTFDTSIESHLSKYRSLMPSLALIFHLLDRVTGRTTNDLIGFKYVELAAAWCSYLQKHAEKLYGMVSMSEFDRAREILKRIAAKQLTDGFTARDIYGKHWKGLTKPEEVKGGLEILTDYGYLNTTTINDGHRPKIVYFINGSLK